MSAALGVAALLGGAVGLLHGRAAGLWWTNDDFYAIHLLWKKSVPEALLSTGAWRQSRMFTPLLLVSFDADLHAFGLRPRVFYAHQLAALAGAAAALYVALRLWLPRGAALVASLLFLCGVPTIAWSRELLVRQYAEGLILAALATRLFVLSVRRDRAAPAWGSALLYLGAMLEKEVYVPLVALLVLLPESDARRRLRRLVPHGVAVAAYVAARWAVLGTPGGGYGWTVRAGELPGVIARLPAAAARSLLSGSAWDWVLLVALAAGVAAALWVSGRRGAGLFAAALVLALAPVVPVAKAFQDRYAGLAWVAVCAAFGFGCAALARRGRAPAAAGLAASALVAAVLVQRRAGESRWATAERMSAEGMSFMGMSAGEHLRHPAIPPAAMVELRWLKEDGLGRARGAPFDPRGQGPADVRRGRDLERPGRLTDS